MSKKNKKSKATSIKPCPFCNSQDPEKYSLQEFGQTRQIVCMTCGSFGPVAPTDAEALEKWNARIVSVVSKEVYDKMVKASEGKTLEDKDGKQRRNK
jgi:Lar family restriction alleviation protein